MISVSTMMIDDVTEMREGRRTAMLLHQVHASGSVRHAEKRRVGTCLFANRIARSALDAYDAVVPLEFRTANKSQTCVAAVVAHFSEVNIEGGGRIDEKDQGQLQVMGLGVGTKFLSDCILREEESNSGGECYGKRIRDCHAEVLAVRAFRRQLSLEIFENTWQMDNRGQTPNDKAREQRGTAYSSILELVESSSDDGFANLESKAKGSNRRYRLKSNITLHFYASSAPFLTAMRYLLIHTLVKGGNATLKKFVKMEKEKFDPSLGPDQWPEQTHEPIAAHSLRLGQFALLVKRDGSMVSPQPQLPEYPPEGEERTHLETVTKSNAQSNRRKLWPCFENDNWCPPSTSIPNFNKGTLHSCSDKICRWNCLGMQGSLLMAMLDSPLYMTTLTVGRKFSKIICQRALCCRANGFGTSKEAKVEDSSKGNHTRFRLNHPVLMETSVYMDESGTHDMAGIRHVGQDATFDSNLCWVWWPGKTSNFGYAADCLESGLKINYHHRNDGSDVEPREVLLSIPSTFSECSTYAMFHSIMAISHGSSTVETKMSLSLKDILQRKRNLSFDYESAKDELFRHRVFFQWCRRGCCSRNP